MWSCRKLTYAGNPRNIADLPADRVQLVVGDICDVPLANRLVAESDAVVNFAAESHNDNSMTDPAPFLTGQRRERMCPH